jgi:hypothetical protein
MRLRLYTLDDHKPVPCDDVRAWARWYERVENRCVDYTAIEPDISVSTIFLGIDTSTRDPPVLFETVVFAGARTESESQRRCCTWDEARQQHAAIVALVRSRTREH